MYPHVVKDGPDEIFTVGNSKFHNLSDIWSHTVTDGNQLHLFSSILMQVFFRIKTLYILKDE